MKNITPKGFLTVLLLIFFGSVFADVLRMILGLDVGAARVTIYAVSAVLLSFVLYNRLVQLHQNRTWAVLGLIPPLGLAFGLYLYVSAPKTDERHAE
jgi:hypothetical protein